MLWYSDVGPILFIAITQQAFGARDEVTQMQILQSRQVIHCS